MLCVCVVNEKGYNGVVISLIKKKMLNEANWQGVVRQKVPKA